MTINHRRSRSCVSVIALLALLSVFHPLSLPAQAPAKKTEPQQQRGRSYSVDEPKTPPPPGPNAPSPVTFTDLSALSKVGFKHAGSPTSVKYLLETMGGGVVIFDYNNDGRMDLFFTNGALLKDPMPKGEATDKSDARFWNRLYRQKSDGTFEDVTERAGLKGEGFDMGAASGDYDNDADDRRTRKCKWRE